MTDPIWRGMTRDQLDTAYDNTKAVAHSGPTRERWKARSARFRATENQSLDLVYGPKPRNKIDLFRCGAPEAPLFVFIHGGYWQRNDKETFACMAEGPLANSFDVALLGYTLTPDVTLTELVAETHAAIRFLRAGPCADAASLTVSGWSAGGHLTAMAMTLDEVDAGLAISGIYDIAPCRLNYLNDKLRLTEAEVAALSPIRHLAPNPKPMTVAYGANELPELQRQSVDYAHARVAAGLPTEVLALPGHDHFSILDELQKPNGKLTEALVRLVGRVEPDAHFHPSP